MLTPMRMIAASNAAPATTSAGRSSRNGRRAKLNGGSVMSPPRSAAAYPSFPPQDGGERRQQLGAGGDPFVEPPVGLKEVSGERVGRDRAGLGRQLRPAR